MDRYAKKEFGRQLSIKYGSNFSPQERKKEINRLKSLESSARYKLKDVRTADEYKNKRQILESLDK